MPIKKKEVLKILYDRWAKDSGRDKCHSEVKYTTLMEFVKMMTMDVETKNDIL